jgi:hypothetical protein
MTKEQTAQADAVDIAYSMAAVEQDTHERAEGMHRAPDWVGLAARRALSILWYPIAMGPELDVRNDPAAQEQIRAFETKLKAAKVPSVSGVVPAPDEQFVVIDGRLNGHKMTALQRAAQLATVTPIIESGASRPSVLITTFPEGFGFAFASGSAVIRADQIALPINWVETECDREMSRCVLERTELSGPSARGLLFSGAQYYQLLSRPTREHYKITRWTDEVIEARSVSSPSESECRFTTLTLNAISQSASMITQDTGETCELPSGVAVPPMDGPRVVLLQGTGAVLARHFGEILDYVEQFHGPLAVLGYDRPFVGAAVSAP